jgi:hypothetical protein
MYSKFLGPPKKVFVTIYIYIYLNICRHRDGCLLALPHPLQKIFILVPKCPAERLHSQVFLATVEGSKR